MKRGAGRQPLLGQWRRAGGSWNRPILSRRSDMARNNLAKPVHWIALALLAAVGVTASPLFAEPGDKKLNPENVQAKADKPDGDGKQKILVTMKIHPDYRVFAN